MMKVDARRLSSASRALNSFLVIILEYKSLRAKY